ncbi:LysR family transcriptional regulator [Roseateles saccharophilus]|uniref:DNA-binding transcriptional LysR family regulator n=1 Tax=Roseateles saccharophilus TaxID=304 RepID=A0A4R3VL25_ROSSA|nr:LysR family transcriptional regulator [Roseateles saccharophilus]MDG0832844.1 LysR family transcriptional regulator [Roseateles saccharophilus]TCV03795.1 DNA-binding transcriptional LysR family regulator [Roseateles saccharophilus]
MGRLEDLQAFARVVDARGFSGAARLLGTTKSAVSKQVVRLEDQLGTRLLHRTTRSVSPTAEGHAVYERALRLLDEALALETELAGRRDEPRGVLRLSVSTAFGNLQCTALMAEFCARHPQIDVVLGLNDRYVDLAEEGFDVVLRLTHRPSDGLVARRLAAIRFVLCAAPAYLAAHGEPLTVAEIASHRCLRFGYLQSPDRWRFRHAGLGEAGVETRGALRFESGLTANSSESLRIAALAGMGLTVLPTYAIGADLRAGRLRALLPEWQPVGGLADADTLYAVYLPGRTPRHPAPKVRALIDFMLEKMGEVPPWDREEVA